MTASQPQVQPKQDGTIGKSLDLLDMVAAAPQPLRFADLLSLSGHPKATLHRHLKTLVSQDMLSFDAERQTYSLGVRLVVLAHAAWRQSSLAPVARPFVDRLAHDTGLTVHLAQLAGAQVLYVDKRNARQSVEMFSQAGRVGPAYCTGVGKAMLAYLAETQLDTILEQQSFHGFTETTQTTAPTLKAELAVIRAQGVSYDREEHERGIICLAAPILSAAGLPLAAVSVTTTTQQSSLEALTELKPLLLQAARDISNVAQAWRFPTMSADSQANPEHPSNSAAPSAETGDSHVSSYA